MFGYVLPSRPHTGMCDRSHSSDVDPACAPWYHAKKYVYNNTSALLMNAIYGITNIKLVLIDIKVYLLCNNKGILCSIHKLSDMNVRTYKWLHL